MQRGRRSPAWNYATAILLATLAMPVQELMHSWIGGARSTFLLAYPAVFFTVWLGGRGPGLLSTLLSGLGAWYVFMPSVHGFAVPVSGDLLKLGVFLVMGCVFSVLVPASQRKLQELNQDFLALLEHTSDFVYFKDKDSRIRFCSQTLAKVTGHRHWSEMVGKHDLEIFPQEIARIYYEEELPVFREGKPLLNRVDPYFDEHGNRGWVSTSKWPVLGKDNKTVVGIFGISRDITEQKRAEEELQQQSLENEMLLRSASDGIHILDSEGNIIRANDVFCQMLGYTREEVLKLNVAQWDARWSARELKHEVIPSMLERRQVFETRHRRRDGRMIDVEVSAAGMDLGGRRVLFAASRDITERKRAEANLQRLAAELTEANRLKDIFTDVLRHDILTPISTITMATDLLLRLEPDANKTRLLQKIQRSTSNLVEMAENSAKLALVTAGRVPEFVAADPVQVLRSMLPDFEHALREKNITITDHCDSGFSASFNPMMKDVFANLISNAIKYSPGGTVIDISAEDRGESWVLSVKDQGAGVPEEHRQKIFNRFERLGREGVKGSGLGLAITKQIVDLHHGEIRVEANPSGGSVFFVRLPKDPKAPDARPATPN